MLRNPGLLLDIIAYTQEEKFQLNVYFILTFCNFNGVLLLSCAVASYLVATTFTEQLYLNVSATGEASVVFINFQTVS